MFNNDLKVYNPSAAACGSLLQQASLLMMQISPVVYLFTWDSFHMRTLSNKRWFSYMFYNVAAWIISRQTIACQSVAPCRLKNNEGIRIRKLSNHSCNVMSGLL